MTDATRERRRTQQRERASRMRQAAREDGLCPRCNKRRPAPRSRWCAPCLTVATTGRPSRAKGSGMISDAEREYIAHQLSPFADTHEGRK